MLIYEKKVSGERHLFGTLANVPSDADLQLTYKDNDGAVIADIKALKYFYNKSKCIFANDSTNQIPEETDTKVNVWLGDKLIIGTVENQ